MRKDYYSDSDPVRKWERLSLLRAQVRYMEQALPESKGKEKKDQDLFDFLPNGEAAAEMSWMHTGIIWQEASELNREITRRQGLDAYRDAY